MNPKLAGLFRLLAALSLLVAALVFFELPLRLLAARAGAIGNPLAGLFGPAPGFMATIQSQPPGAAIRIDGKNRGVTPFLGNVAGRQGERVAVEIALAGYKPWKRELDCRENGQLSVEAKLSR